MIKTYKSTMLEPAAILQAFELKHKMTPEEVLENMREMWAKLQEDTIKFTTDRDGYVVTVTYPHGYKFETTGIDNFIIKDEVKAFRSLNTFNFKTYYVEVV